MLRIAGPNILATMAETCMSMVDFAVVSLIGPAAQAAVSSGAMVYFSLFGLLMGTLVCVTTMVSQSLGAGRIRDCAAYAWQGLWLSAAFGIIGVAMWPIIPGLYAVIGHEPLVQQMEVEYTRIRLLSMGVAGAGLGLGHYFNGIHHPRQTMISVVIANLLNAVLTYGLVLGRWGLPEMGVAGAAWGTVVATIVRLGWLWGVMCFGRFGREFHGLHGWRLDWEKMGRLVWIGLPSGLAFVLDIAAWATFVTVIVGRFGTAHLAATATCWRLTELSFMPAIGIGAAVTTVIGKAIGQGRNDLAYRRAALGAVLNTTYMGLMGLIFLIYGRWLMELFSNDPEVIRVGRQVLICAAVFQTFDGVALTYIHALRGAGDTRWPAVVGPLQAWGIMIVGSAWVARAHPQLGSLGPWLFATAFVIIIGTTFWLRWRSGRWERIDAIGRTEPGAIPPPPVAPEAVLAEQRT